MRKILLTAAAVTATALTLTACSGSNADSTDAGATEFIMAEFPTGNTLDPWSTQISIYTAQATYDTLVHLDEAGDVVPWLATSWEFTDETTLQMELRDDVTFTDGTKFDADAVKANIEYALAQTQPNVPALTTLTNIAEVEVVDADTVVFHLTEANPDIVFDFSQQAGWMASPTALEDPESLATTPVGSGPYVIDEDATVANDTYTFTKNPDYWADDEFERFDTFVVRMIEDPSATLNAASTNEVAYAAVENTDEIAGWEISNGANIGFKGMAIFDVAGTLNPALGDVRVRQAMNYALDRQTILETVLGGHGEINPSTPYGSASPGWTEAFSEYYDYDVDKAKELLAEAGYGDGFSVEVIVNPAWSDLAQAIAGYVREIGIDMTLTEVSSNYIQAVNSGEYAMATIQAGVYGIPFTDFSLMTPLSPINPFKPSDPTINELRAQAAATTDTAEQTALYLELAEYAVQQAWYLVPALTSEAHAFNPEVVSVTESERGGTPMLYHMVPATN